ncbi:hypothetical protein [Clostridium sp. HBUAS56017]|uniref:hypothetical protein n=1 Tax=Clostridium sp. HBUAS56017 TaxID=2571128 RepID=UPI001FA955CE|nr:hypothetical protein [Clostridium sp. HBUAS56017]
MTVTSTPGGTNGTTKITVKETLDSGNSYMYKAASTVTIPEPSDICNVAAGFSAWDGTSDITATTGNEIVIIEVDSKFKAIKSGKTTVVAKA